MNALIVEDDCVSAEILFHFLADFGIKAVIAENGEKAMVWINQSAFDIVITDYYMPGMSGAELCRKIRGSQINAKARVIVVSISDESQDKLICKHSGANAYLVKPLSLNRLAPYVERNHQGTFRHLV